MNARRVLMLVMMVVAVCLVGTGVGVGAADDVNLTLAGHFGGPTYAVAVSGNYTYIGQGGDLVVLDMSSPDSPVELGRVMTSGTVCDIAVSGSYAYVADESNGLVVVDISNSTAPTLAGSYNTAGSAWGVTVEGSYAYIADESNGLVVVDISNPAAPNLAGSYNTAGSAWGVTIEGSYVYVADYYNGLVVVDISNPAAPTLAGSYNTAGVAFGVTVEGSYAYVADNYNGLVVVDISNPATPTLAGSYNTAGNALGVTVEGSYAYVADESNGLAVVDISSPAAPTLAGSYNTAGLTCGVTVEGSYVYVADDYNGLVVVDISNLATPTLAGSYNTAGNAFGVTVEGNYAYVVDGDNSLIIIDISNPVASMLAGSYNTAEIAFGVTVEGNYAYVADGNNGLVIIDISNPAAPMLAGSYDTAGFAEDVTVEGNYAYVADGYNGLAVVDINSPAAPTLTGRYDTAGFILAVTVEGNYAYVADIDYGLVIIDISSPAVPTLAGSYNTAGDAHCVTVEGNYAYVADGYNGLVILHTDASGTDTTPPELEIISHTNGETVYTSTITVEGTASDASGIAEVRVNGALATNNEASDWSTWSAEVTLVENENPITVVATDGAGRTTTRTVTVTYSPIAVNAEIVDLCIMGDETFDRTETVTAAVTVKNTGNVEHEFYIGLSVYDPNEGIYDAEPVPVTLEPDDTSIKYLTWTVPIDAFGGSWDVTVAVWDRVEGGELCEEYDRVTEDDVFLVNDPVDKYAILVGINDYPGEDNDLDCSCNSASAMSTLLNIRYGFPGDHIQMLTDCIIGTEVLDSDIEEAFRVVVEEEHIDSNDIFVFYFAGHGGRSECGKEWIALSRGDMYDWKLGNLVDTTLRPPYVNPTAIIILDSCHSGGMAYDTDPEPERAGVNGDKAIILMSTSAEEGSYQSGGVGLSAFTYVLHLAFTSDEDDANQDDDERVSLEEAFTYAHGRIVNIFDDQHPQIMDHYPTSANNGAQCYLDVVDPTSITAVAGCPIHLHAYDSEGRHTGMNSAGDDVESEISGSCYSGPEFDPETIVVLGQSDNITYRIEALNDGEFNFTVVQTTDTKTVTVLYENISITETTNATIDVNSSNLFFTMEIDYDGDGITDNTTGPTHVQINHAPNVSITTPAGDQNGNVTISYNLKDAESDNCTITAQYSLDNITWLDARAGEGGDGMINITSASAGMDHMFVWASDTDMQNQNTIVYFRIRPYDGDLAGDYATTGAFFIGNYLAGSISIGSANTPTNSTVTIPVSVANVTNISGVSFGLLYNSSVVTVSSVSANESFIGSSITPNIDNANGTTRIVLTNLNCISALAETPVIDIAFNITGGFGSFSTLDLQNVEFSDSGFNPYTPAVVVDGLITVGVKGDFNNNGRVDIGDVAKVAFMVAGMVPEDLSADFNDNGYVDIGDAAKIAFYLAGKVSEL